MFYLGENSHESRIFCLNYIHHKWSSAHNLPNWWTWAFLMDTWVTMGPFKYYVMQNFRFSDPAPLEGLKQDVITKTWAWKFKCPSKDFCPSSISYTAYTFSHLKQKILILDRKTTFVIWMYICYSILLCLLILSLKCFGNIAMFPCNLS